ncbi:MAG: spermidine/putrescine ABC transporter substrate-binding protein [Thermoleophilia bacterium]|nr:spermidine/putrescine ABC transporter substrate-binding protein [Thermoleophilia bacterium]
MVARGDLRHSERRESSMNPRMTRRTLVKRGAAGAALLSLPSFLAACGGGGGGGAEVSGPLRFANWQLYIDIDEATKKSPTLEAFTAETGISVEYFEEINANDEYFGKIQGPLSAGQSIDRDIIVLTDVTRYPKLLIDNGWLEEIDRDLIPNFDNLVQVQKSPPFDPDRKWSIPWQSGITGIAYNAKLAPEPITSMAQLLEDPRLKGKVTVVDGFEDTGALVMLANGDDPSNVTDEAYQKAIDRIQKAVDSGQIRQFTGNDYTGPLAKGDLIAAVAWSGDIVQLAADNPDLKWGVPDDGGMIWTDTMFVPKGGNVAAASKFMNFVLDPAIAAQLAAYINYITPVAGARDEAAKLDAELAQNPLIFPNEETLGKVHQYDANAASNDVYLEKWAALKGA